MFSAIHSKVCLKKTFPVPFFLFLRVLKSLFNRSASHFLFHISLILLCIFLGGCSGDSSSKSPSNNSSSEPEPEKDCKIENGVAELRDGECKVVACNVGHYKPVDGNTCIEGGEKRYRPCKIVNGEGELTWSHLKGEWNDDCQLIACDAGYDDHNKDGDCDETQEGHYSKAGSKQRIVCFKPDDSSWTSGTGLTKADECVWACDAGYDNSQNAKPL